MYDISSDTSSPVSNFSSFQLLFLYPSDPPPTLHSSPIPEGPKSLFSISSSLTPFSSVALGLSLESGKSANSFLWPAGVWPFVEPIVFLESGPSSSAVVLYSFVGLCTFRLWVNYNVLLCFLLFFSHPLGMHQQE